MSDEIKNRTVCMLCRADKTGDDGEDVYVGSTSLPLGKRFESHKQDARNPFRLKHYGDSKLYRRMRDVGVQHWKIIPLLTFPCDRKTICEFEREWIKALNAGLNTFSSIDDDLV